jgi:hypothetical protein
MTGASRGRLSGPTSGLSIVDGLGDDDDDDDDDDGISVSVLKQMYFQRKIRMIIFFINKKIE